MREILFRGKRVDNGEWVYGYFVHQYGANEIYLNDAAEFERHHIDPETVGQYTGLTDKDGKRIFEGDIVITDGEHCLISWDEDAAAFDIWVYGHSFYCDSDWAHTVEIIGNILDNPELLEG